MYIHICRETISIYNIDLLDLEWKMIYVGSAESEEFDQVLDTIYVGPIPEGRHMFVFQVRYHESADINVFYIVYMYFIYNLANLIMLNG